jgi:membrane protease subunit (stomatin/prohibitin family)
MKTDKQAIEEMAKVIKSSLDGLGCGNFNFTGDEISIMFAKALYNADYRKQSEGEWYDGICTNCGHEALDYLDETPCGCTMRTYITKFCPNCGAKMKGGE